MSKVIEIQHKTIEIVSSIKVDGQTYPLHRRNQEIAEEYEATKDESVLDKLLDFSLELS